MRKLFIVLIFALSLPAISCAQTFLDRLRKPVKGQGTVTVSQDVAIDALVNGPWRPATSVTNSVPTSSTSSSSNKSTKPSGNTTATKSKSEESASASQDATEEEENRKKVMADSYKIDGYRVQVYAGGNTRQDRQKAEKAGEDIKSAMPGTPIYVHFYSPRWICRIGNYRTYEEAHKVLLEVREKGYTQATIVKGKISVQY